MNTNTTTKPQFPCPAGALEVEEWQLGSPRADGSPPELYRNFTGRTWTIERPEGERDITVKIEGVQQLHGVGQRAIGVMTLDGGEAPLSITEARDLARALIAACDEATEMFDRDEASGLSDLNGTIER